MTKRHTCEYLQNEQARLRDRKAEVIAELISIEDKLEVLDGLASAFICEDNSPQGRMETRKLADEVSEELKK